MAEIFTDIAIVEIDGVLCRSIKSLTVDISDNKTVVKTMNPERRARGVTRGVPDFTAKLTVVSEPSDPEVDYVAWMLNKEPRLIVYDLNGDGARVQLIDCYVNSVGEKYDDGGESVFDVDVVFLDRKED
jgi:hypothetical protein